jgi:hypothetical protein
MTDEEKRELARALGSLTSAKKKASSAKNAKKATKKRMAMTPEERRLQAILANDARWAEHRAAKAKAEKADKPPRKKKKQQ